MKSSKLRRGGWSGGTPPEYSHKLMWWCLALGISAVATACYVILSR